MPKQTGTLRALKASLKILYNRRDSEFVSNDEFREEIIKELKFSKEEQNPPKMVKQSEMARYFGLSGFYKKNFDRKQKILLEGIKFYESKNNEEKISIIFDQLKKISFGKNNAAIKESDSIIDPPKLFLKAIYELEFIEKKEFAILLYRTVNQKKTFRESIIEIIECREQKKKVSDVPQEYKNIYYDYKFNVFFKEIGILKEIKSKYYFSFFTNDNYLNVISNLSIYNDIKELDQKYINNEEIINEKINYHLHNKEILRKLNERKPNLKTNSIDRYVTQRRIKETALKDNNYECFFDKSHKTFLMVRGAHYMEGHHVIPMKAQKDFKLINIDRVENILCLCPNCHRKVHLSLEDEKKKLLSEVYNLKKNNLFKANLKISFEDLYKKYYSKKIAIDFSSLQNQSQIKKALLIEKIVKDRVQKDQIGSTEEEISRLTNQYINEYVKKN
jgi:hypothetical protein